MTTFTSSLPEKLLKRLDSAAKKLAVPKNRLIEKALEIYLEQLNRAEYVKSFKRVTQDEDIMAIAEEGMTEYLTQINDETR